MLSVLAPTKEPRMEPFIKDVGTFFFKFLSLPLTLPLHIGIFLTLYHSADFNLKIANVFYGRPQSTK